MEISGFELLAISAPLFGTSSDEGSEALPYNRVYFTLVGAWKTKPLLTKPDSSGSDSSSELANGGATAPMKY